MKKALFTSLAIILVCTANTSYSQGSTSSPRLQYSDEELVASQTITVTLDSAAFAPAEIRKAVKSFTRDYKDVSNAKWLQLNDGYSVVYFTVDGVKTRLLYNKKGVCESIIRYYFEEKLPTAIRHLVKSTSYDFHIFHVIEPTINGVTSYLVKMEDKTTWKTIKVVDGEIEVVEEYSKLK